MKKFLAISLATVLPAVVTGCFVQSTPPPEEPATTSTAEPAATAAPAPTTEPAPAPTEEEPKKSPFAVPNLGGDDDGGGEGGEETSE